jgi:mono/diheme cytochrome c family protein
MNLGKILKWIGIVLGGLVGLVILAVVVLYVVATSRLNKNYDIQVEAISVPSDEAALERGQHLVEVVSGCTECHADNLGGKAFFDDPAIGLIYSSNVTSGTGGIGEDYTDTDWIRAMRHGVGPDGKPLMIMPSQNFYHLTDEDLGAMIAYLKSIPAVDNESPEPKLTPMAHIIFALGGLGKMPAEIIDHTGSRPSAPEMGVTADYGGYLVSVSTCRDCHGVELNGGQAGPNEPFGPNLTRGGNLVGWTEVDFITAMRTGVTPSGRQLYDFMPWQTYGQMTDEELKAIWLYLDSLPAMETASQ